MTVRQFAPQNATDRSIQLAQTTTVPWGQMGVSGDSARGFGLANPRGTAANPPRETAPRGSRLLGWLNIGLTISEALRMIVGPPPIRVSEIAIGDADDLAIRIYGRSYHGPEAGTAVFIGGIGGASLGVPATVAEDGLRFDVAALERAYGKQLPAMLTAGGAAIGSEGSFVVERRDSAVHPNLSTISTRARALVQAQSRFQRWEAHHLIPFAAMAKLPVPSQLAIARSGWKMDSTENLVVLPGDEPTYEAAPNFRSLPYHSGPHDNYNFEVENRLSHLAWAAPTLDPRDIRAELGEIEATMFQQLLDRRRGFHPRVSQNMAPYVSAFG